MQDVTIINAMEGKYIELLDDLVQRGRRRWAAAEARALGRGGITTVALAIGMSDRAIRLNRSSEASWRGRSRI